MDEVTLDQEEAFRRDGFVAIGPLLGADELRQLRAAHEELLVRWAADCDVTVEEYTRVVSQWTGLWREHRAFATHLHHPVLARIARRLLKADRLRLFHDHLISKPPRHSSTIPWHQDYPYWPVDRPRALSCWLALDDATADAGALVFMPGAQQEGEQPPVDFLRSNKDWGERIHASRAVPVTAGTCVFHSCLSWHMSPPNATDRPRRALIVIYMDADNRWDPDHSGWHPMNAHVTVPRGERFNDDQFPLIALADPEVRS